MCKRKTEPILCTLYRFWRNPKLKQTDKCWNNLFSCISVLVTLYNSQLSVLCTTLPTCMLSNWTVGRWRFVSIKERTFYCNHKLSHLTFRVWRALLLGKTLAITGAMSSGILFAPMSRIVSVELRRRHSIKEEPPSFPTPFMFRMRLCNPWLF